MAHIARVAGLLTILSCLVTYLNCLPQHSVTENGKDVQKYDEIVLTSEIKETSNTTDYNGNDTKIRNRRTINFEDFVGMNNYLTIQSIQFFGYADTQFAELTVNFAEQNAVLRINLTAPHRNFEEYINIKVIDNKGATKYEKSVDGKKEGETVIDNFQLQINDIIQIYHVEGEIERLKSNDNQLLHKSQYNTLRFTKYGLQNNGLNYDRKLSFVQNLTETANNILSNEHLNFINPYVIEFLHAVNLLEKPHRRLFLDFVLSACQCSLSEAEQYLSLTNDDDDIYNFFNLKQPQQQQQEQQ